MRKTREEIERKVGSGVMLLDGATGTVLYGEGGRHPEMLSITHPRLVADLHRKYLDAGTDIIRTNTFNACSLSDDMVERVTRAAVRIARECVDSSGCEALVAGVVSPLGDKEKFNRQIGALIRGGADILLFETVMSCESMLLAYETACEQENAIGVELP
ncbi:MAG: homocysteine S-methyltransferase family protein, partial [Muribaculaceae bacterium]|nr:homocysteine S-methyltransferase family protein [Muribaculaceae bacterium]